MNDKPKSANFELLISRSAAWEQFRDALRMFVGRGKRYKVSQVYKGTGIAERMIESFMARTDSTDWRKPDLEEVLSLCSFIGPDFTTELLAPAAQCAYWLPETDVPPGDLAADNSDDNAKIVRAAKDVKFDRGEKPILKTVGVNMMNRGAQLVAIASAA